MGAITMLACAELRNRWRSVVVLVLLVGVSGAVVLASVAGERRTASALHRFQDESLAANVDISVGHPTAAKLHEFRRVPNVEAVGTLLQLTLVDPNIGFIAAAGKVDNQFGRTIDKARLIEGREARAIDELTIGEGLAAQLHVGVGDRIRYASYTPAQVTESPGEPAGPTVTFRVVGIVRRPLDLGGLGANGGVLVMTRAFTERYRDEIGSFSGFILRVRTRHGTADVPQVVAAARRIFGGAPEFQVDGLASEGRSAQSGIDVAASALWLLAVAAALAAVVAVALALGRFLARGADDQPTLSALGARRRVRWAGIVASSVPAALAGAAVAAVGAVMLSPLFPIGVARDAEPDPGLSVDWVTLGLGFVAVFAVIISLAALIAARTSARRVSPIVTPRRTSRLDHAPLPPPLAAGVRHALQGGRVRTGSPVGAPVFGAITGVIGIVAALVFSASLNQLVTTPSHYGWGWDVAVVNLSAGDRKCDSSGEALIAMRQVTSVSALCYGDLEISRHPANGFAFRSIRGTIGPSITRGRAPMTAHEVALGADTLDAVGASIGDRITVTARKGRIHYVVVGRAIFPSITDAQPLADGVLFTPAGLRAAGVGGNDYFVFDLARGAQLEPLVPALTHIGGGLAPITAAVPAEVERIRQVDAIPTALAGFVAAVALASVGYALFTAVRRRRRDFAVLKTLGFTKGQVRVTVATHATTVVLVGAVVGVPLGVVVGRVIWRAVADGLGVAADPTWPVLGILLLVPAALLVVNSLAALPASTAARTRPAIVLRSE